MYRDTSASDVVQCLSSAPYPIGCCSVVWLHGCAVEIKHLVVNFATHFIGTVEIKTMVF